VDRSGSILALNRAWARLASGDGPPPKGSAVGDNYLDLCDQAAVDRSEDARATATALRRVLTGDMVETDLEYRCSAPVAGRWLVVRVSPLGGPDPGALISYLDVTRRTIAEQSRAHEASHDPLTGLANRTLFTTRLTAALTPRAGRPAAGDVGVLFIDLDKFKLVNDRFGHRAGDDVLVTVSQRLRNTVRPQDTVARLGGDEFAITAPRITSAGLAGLAQRVSQELAQPHRVQGSDLEVPASVGRYLAVPGESAADALAHADRAMYAVKRAQSSHAVPVPASSRLPDQLGLVLGLPRTVARLLVSSVGSVARWPRR
jgi:diguanylate cyclase (GGDEF)-like protein